jgi:antirestriction protein ArdC
LKVLRADKKAIFAASAQARTAAEYLTRGAGMDAAEEDEAAAAK